MTDDPTERLNRNIERTTQKFMDWVEMGGNTVINRPIGSQKLSKQEQKKQYRERRIEPEYQQALVREFIDTRGYPKGVVDYIDYVEEMMKDA